MSKDKQPTNLLEELVGQTVRRGIKDDGYYKGDVSYLRVYLRLVEYNRGLTDNIKDLFPNGGKK